MSLHVVLVEPEIPQNTGSIARTCATTGAVLHLIHPLGFHTDDNSVRRAGLDYWNLVEIRYHDSLDAFLHDHENCALFLFSTRGATLYTEVNYPDDTYIVFGKETAGLPDWLVRSADHTSVRIPIREATRSLNLSNAVSIALYECLRQDGFSGLATTPRNQTPGNDV